MDEIFFTDDPFNSACEWQTIVTFLTSPHPLRSLKEDKKKYPTIK